MVRLVRTPRDTKKKPRSPEVSVTSCSKSYACAFHSVFGIRHTQNSRISFNNHFREGLLGKANLDNKLSVDLPSM